MTHRSSSAVTHVSNALGTINPVKHMIALAHERGVPVLVDGAQAAPHMRVDVQDLDCDFYAFSGHKMCGPTGIGILYGKAAMLERMQPFKGGGDMILSVTFEKTMYNTIPHKFEAGTPPIAAAIGLGAAVDYLSAIGMDAIAAHEQDLLDYATERISRMPGVRIIGTAAEKAAVISFAIDGVHPHDVGTLLNQEGVAVRTGHHCAQPVMQRFGVPATSRASFAFYNTHGGGRCADRRHSHRAEGVCIMTDSRTLYQEVILDHNRKPRNFGAIEDATHRAEGHNPLCGDHISVTLDVDGDRVDAIAFQGEACAICKASASMMTVTVKGKTRDGRGNADPRIPRHGHRQPQPRRPPPHRTARGLRRRARPADACQMRNPAVAYVASRVQFGGQHVDRGGKRSDARIDRWSMS